MVLKQSSIILSVTIVEWTHENITKYTANIPCCSKLCAYREILVISCQIQTCNILWVIGIAVVATLVVRINNTISIKVNKYTVTWFQIANQLLWEWLAKLLLIISLCSLVIQFPEFVLQM